MRADNRLSGARPRILKPIRSHAAFGALLLDFLTVRRLAFQEEGLEMLPFSAKLERSEVFVPRAIWDIRRIPPPFLKREQIIYSDLSLSGAVK
jgi:hypothetical protein